MVNLKELMMEEYKKNSDKNAQEFKKQVLMSIFITLILTGFFILFGSLIIRVIKYINGHLTLVAIIFIVIGWIGLYFLMRKKHEN